MIFWCYDLLSVLFSILWPNICFDDNISCIYDCAFQTLYIVSDITLNFKWPLTYIWHKQGIKYTCFVVNINLFSWLCIQINYSNYCNLITYVIVKCVLFRYGYLLCVLYCFVMLFCYVVLLSFHCVHTRIYHSYSFAFPIVEYNDTFNGCRWFNKLMRFKAICIMFRDISDFGRRNISIIDHEYT